MHVAESRGRMESFWKVNSRDTSSIQMMLDNNADELGESDIPEILDLLPSSGATDILELGAGIGWDARPRQWRHSLLAARPRTNISSLYLPVIIFYFVFSFFSFFNIHLKSSKKIVKIALSFSKMAYRTPGNTLLVTADNIFRSGYPSGCPLTWKYV